MANSTLRLDDVEEEKLAEIMRHYGEATKAKAISRMIASHLDHITYHSEFSKRCADQNRTISQIKDAVLKVEDARNELLLMVSG